MKICFVVNSVESEKSGTTGFIMHEARNRGHQVYAMGVGDFSYTNEQNFKIDVTSLPKNASPKTAREFIDVLHSDKAKKEKIDVKDLDVLFIRNNPTEESEGRNWAEHSGVAFGRIVQKEGVIVLNDGYGLTYAFFDKLYFEELPSSIKPASIITRNKEDILEFFENHKKKMVLKPLEGSGGRGVYLIDKNEKNLNQIIENLAAQGYIIAQEFLPAVKDGDVRVLLLNGRVMQKDEKYGVIRRISSEGEFRSNISQGATTDVSEYTDEMRKIVDIVAPKLIRDGLFFVGLDIVKDKLIEINVLSPGGMDSFPVVGLPDFSDVVVKAIERKLIYKKNYGKMISNRVLATMD